MRVKEKFGWCMIIPFEIWDLLEARVTSTKKNLDYEDGDQKKKN